MTHHHPVLAPLTAAARCTHRGAAVQRRLDLEVEAVLRRAEEARAPITHLFDGVVPTRPRLYRGTGMTDWVLLRMEDDPLYRAGDFPIPRAVHRNLRRLRSGGVEMDDVLVAHEVPRSTVAGLLPAAGERALVLDHRELHALIDHPGPAGSTRRTTERAGRIAGAVGRAVRVAGAGAAVVAAAPLALLAGLDPILFGTLRSSADPELTHVFELARWDW